MGKGQVIRVHSKSDNKPTKLIGVDPLNDKKCITISDMIAMYSYVLSLLDNIGNIDDIDMLGNRRVKTVGELIQNEFRIGLARMEKSASVRRFCLS